MGFSKQEYWDGLPFPSSGDLPNPGIKPGAPAFQVDSLPSQSPGENFWLYTELFNYNLNLQDSWEITHSLC